MVLTAKNDDLTLDEVLGSLQLDIARLRLRSFSQAQPPLSRQKKGPVHRPSIQTFVAYYRKLVTSIRL